MNILAQHDTEKAVSVYPLFKGEGTVIALRIKAEERLKEHTTKTEALLVCVTGKARFANEKGISVELLPGDFIKIEPMVVHWVDGIEASNLLLMK